MLFVKVVVVDCDGEVLKVAEWPYAPVCLWFGWSEMDFEVWWRAVEDVLDECGVYYVGGIGLLG